MQAGSYRPFGARRTVLLLLVAIGVYDLLGRWLSLPLYPVGGLFYERLGWYVALFVATLTIGWFARDRSWLVGLIGGLCTKGPGVVTSLIHLVRVSWQPPPYAFTGFGYPVPMTEPVVPDLVATFSPLLIGAVLGAVGGFCGQGLRRRLRGDEDEELIKELTETIALEGGDATVYCDRGWAHTDVGELEEGVADFTSALDFDSEFMLALHGRGVAYRELGQYQQSIADLQEAIRLWPEFAEAYCDLGLTRCAAGDYGGAVEDCSRAIELIPDFVEAFHSRGLAHYHLERYEEALNDFTEAIRLDEDFGDAYFDRGVVYDDLGRYDEALANFSEAVRVYPTNVAAYWSRGAILRDREEYERAVADFTRALELDPEYAQAYYDRGMVYRALDQEERATADLEAYLALASEGEEAQIAAAREYVQDKRAGAEAASSSSEDGRLGRRDDTFAQ
jgi:tetratricopeptide (TPR) repeat protein